MLSSGDIPFRGGPGATGRSYAEFGTVVESARTRLLVLPEDTEMLAGHGEPTTTGAEAPPLQEWIPRGH